MTLDRAYSKPTETVQEYSWDILIASKLCVNISTTLDAILTHFLYVYNSTLKIGRKLKISSFQPCKCHMDILYLKA